MIQAAISIDCVESKYTRLECGGGGLEHQSIDQVVFKFGGDLFWKLTPSWRQLWDLLCKIMEKNTCAQSKMLRLTAARYV